MVFAEMCLSLQPNLHKTEQMKRMFWMLGVLLSALAALTSCLGGDEETTVYSDTAITEVTLGTLNRYISGTSANTGNDTVVKSTLTGSSYKLTIDQLAHTIYNRDALPVGTDVEHVVLSTVSTKNSGVVVLKSLISDSLQYITTTDSIDFTKPRTLRVYSSDGTAYRDYTMTLTVSTTTGTTFGWQKVAERNELKGWADKHLVAFGDTVALVDDGIISVSDNRTMDGQPALVRLDKEGCMEFASSLQGVWKAVAVKVPVSRLIGATEHEIFAIGTDGRLKVCTSDLSELLSFTEGAQWALQADNTLWRDEALDDEASLLPTSDIAMTSWSYAPADSTDYVLLAGSCDADDTNATLWRKLSRYHRPGMVTEGQWAYMPIDSENHYTLPRQEGLSIVCYEGVVLAVGSNKEMLLSRDQGISWKTSTTYALPSQLQGSRVTMAADTKGRLWLVTDAGELWMGTLR